MTCLSSKKGEGAFIREGAFIEENTVYHTRETSFMNSVKTRLVQVRD